MKWIRNAVWMPFRYRQSLFNYLNMPYIPFLATHRPLQPPAPAFASCPISISPISVIHSMAATTSNMNIRRTQRAQHRSLLFALLCLFFLSSLTAVVSSQSPNSLVQSRPALMLLSTTLAPFSFMPVVEGKNKQKKTLYDVLELKQDGASLKDIKKAYRRLAVQHHPDRNLGNEEEATVKFREISEAYEVLSDEDSKREYDRSLKSGFDRDSFGGSGGAKWSYGGNDGGSRHQRRQHSRPHRDPFAQFNDVFKNDPFFADAFKSMDDLFDLHFSNVDSNIGNRKRGGGDNKRSNGKDVDKKDEGGWIWNTVKDYLPNVNVEIKSSSSRGGSATSRTTSYSSSSRSSGSSGSSSRSSSRSSTSSTYTSKSTSTVIENGQRVTIQSLEKDGNKIEERYIGEKLIERKINGIKEDIGRIGRVGEEF